MNTFNRRFRLLPILLSLLAIFLSACAAKKESPAVPDFAAFQTMEASAGIGAAPTAACDSKCRNLRQEFRYVVYVGRQIYCYWDLKKADTGLDFDALAASFESAIVTDTSPTEYYALLRKWAAAFHDGHVSVLTTADTSMLQIYTAPIRVEVLAPATPREKLIVSAVSGGTGLAVGDEILTVNGVAARDAITAAVAESSGSTERMRRFWAGRRIVDVLGAANGSAPFVLTVKPVSGAAEKTATLFRNVQITPKPGAAGGPGATGAEQMSARILPNGLGYFRLDGFGGSQDDFLISAAMDSLAQTRGLILDLRQNGGGDLSGDRIIERLIQRSVVRYKRSERLSDFFLAQDPSVFWLQPDATGMFATWHDLSVAPLAGRRYDRPVVVLTSPWCFSACDTFAAALRGNGLATFVGEATGGGTGTPLVFDLPMSPFQFRYSVIRGQTPTGDLIEGVGTSPDVLVEPTAADRAAGTDSVLARGIAILEGQIPPNPAAGPWADATIDTGLPAVGSQSLDRAPTLEENDRLVGIAAFDEKP